ncbi:hypothetical protein BT69DRAFT_362961 [Atractiella rhizophila]|nr:hypothetical protein BT69DRAFT_362961 [Atractiella rhizophila]
MFSPRDEYSERRGFGYRDRDDSLNSGSLYPDYSNDGEYDDVDDYWNAEGRSVGGDENGSSFGSLEPSDSVSRTEFLRRHARGGSLDPLVSMVSTINPSTMKAWYAATKVRQS